MIDPDDDASLVSAMLKLSPGDMSVLKAALHHLESSNEGRPRTGLFGSKGAKSDDVSLLTAVGSSNDLLWSALSKRGWMTVKPMERLPPGSRAFVILRDGRVPIADLLSRCEVELAFAHRSAAIMEEVCFPFLETLGKRVHEAGGKASDAANLLAITLCDFARRAAQAGKGEHVIDDIAANAKFKLSRTLGKTTH